jgi:hypothetical protein
LKQTGGATGNRYWSGRPAAADVPYNRGFNPAGYLIQVPTTWLTI